MRKASAFAALLLLLGVLALGQQPRAQLTMTGVGGGGFGAGGFTPSCSQSTTFLARLSNTTNQVAYDTFICNLVTAGIWCGTSFDVISLYATTVTGDAVLNLCSTSFTATLNGAPNFSANNGYLGIESSTTVYIDTGFNPSTAGGNYTQNSNHFSVWSLTQNTASANIVMGLHNGTNNFTYLELDNAGNARGAANSATDVSAANTTTVGHFWMNRSSSSVGNLYKSGSSIASSGAFTLAALLNGNIYVLNANIPGTGAGGGSGFRIAAATLGTGGLSVGNIGVFCHQLNLYLTSVNGAAAAC